ncbi:MAG: hypothetical protein QXI19_03455 [Candidatus Caldarchaeum sp.]
MVTGLNVIRSVLYHIENTPINGQTMKQIYSGWTSRVEERDPTVEWRVETTDSFPLCVVVSAVPSSTLFYGSSLEIWDVSGVVFCLVLNQGIVDSGRSKQQQANVAHNLISLFTKESIAIRDWAQMVGGKPQIIKWGRVELTSLAFVPNTFNLSWTVRVSFPL